MTLEIDDLTPSSQLRRRLSQMAAASESMAPGLTAFPPAQSDDSGDLTLSNEFGVGVDGHRRAAGALRAKMARLVVCACVAAIACLSLVPGAERPHTGLPGWNEHVIAYAGTGVFLALGYLGWRQRLLGWVGLAAASGVFEILQNFIPERSPSLFDALASTGGLTLGMAFGAVVAAALTAGDRRH